MNRIFLNLKIAWRSLCKFRLRTLLALFGVFLGTFSLIVVSNLSMSLSKKTQAEIENFGKDLLIVRSGVVRRIVAGTTLLSEATTLTIKDSIAIAQKSFLVSDVSPSAHRSFPVRYKDVNLRSVLVTGVMPNYTEVRNFRVRDGIFVTEQDYENLGKVVVIGSRVADKLFGNEDPIGKHILIYRVPCRVVGVMEEKGVDLSGVDQDNQIFIPLSTYLRSLVNRDFVNTIYVKVINGDAMQKAKSEVEDILRINHKITGDKKDDFTVIDLKDVTALKTQAMSMIKILGRISAVVSFSIGGIGILSIMILIINERRLEIGIRRAVGARKRDIISQFLLEASFISLSGGIVGIFIGIIASFIISNVSELPLVISLTGIFLSFIASVSIGIFAGIYPSKKAITIQPVDILRS